jgi:hypothetical protein
VLDINGRLTDRAELIAGAEELASRLRDKLALRVLSADTFGPPKPSQAA